MSKKVVTNLLWISLGLRVLHFLLLILAVAGQNIILPVIFGASFDSSGLLIPWFYLGVSAAIVLLHIFMAARINTGIVGTAFHVLGIILFGGVGDLFLRGASMAGNITYARIYGAEAIARNAGIMQSFSLAGLFSMAANTLLVVACTIDLCLVAQKRAESPLPGYYQPHSRGGNDIL